MGDRLDGFFEEGADQHDAGGFGGNAAAAEVEQLFGVDFADGGAVAAFAVVGVDLQLRLAVHLGVWAEQQGLVHLVAVGLLGSAGDFDLALEHAARLA